MLTRRTYNELVTSLNISYKNGCFKNAQSYIHTCENIACVLRHDNSNFRTFTFLDTIMTKAELMIAPNGEIISIHDSSIESKLSEVNTLGDIQ